MDAVETWTLYMYSVEYRTCTAVDSTIYYLYCLDLYCLWSILQTCKCLLVPAARRPLFAHKHKPIPECDDCTCRRVALSLLSERCRHRTVTEGVRPYVASIRQTRTQIDTRTVSSDASERSLICTYPPSVPQLFMIFVQNAQAQSRLRTRLPTGRHPLAQSNHRDC